MERNNKTNDIIAEVNTEQEEIMDRVNQTFNRISQDVKEMIHENNQVTDI